MDNIARLPAIDRRQLFTTVASQRGLATIVVEKDFWVCWILKRVFGLPNPPAGLIFKGGTSLSKVFKVIERFSEDVDLSFDRSGLGFGGENDPFTASSGKKKKHGVEALVAECRRVIQGPFYNQLTIAIAEALGESAGANWQLELDPNDPDQQTLLFRYPIETQSQQSKLLTYIQPTVRLEIGARADNWPSQTSNIISYAAEDFPDLFTEAGIQVRVLSAERTFWEKATILHSWYHAPVSKRFRDRQSRHYYDLVQMYAGGVGHSALANLELLLHVARHKSVFFATAAARYEEAKPGTLRLAPPETRLSELRQDYEKMKEMIFGIPPDFDHILSVLNEIESTINQVSSKIITSSE